ncbi:MAG: hypothetical protein P8Y45_02140 [Exilibacterium sp.]
MAKPHRTVTTIQLHPPEIIQEILVREVLLQGGLRAQIREMMDQPLVAAQPAAALPVTAQQETTLPTVAAMRPQLMQAMVRLCSMPSAPVVMVLKVLARIPSMRAN